MLKVLVKHSITQGVEIFVLKHSFAQGGGSACLFRWAATTRRKGGQARSERSVLKSNRNTFQILKKYLGISGEICIATIGGQGGEFGVETGEFSTEKQQKY